MARRPPPRAAKKNNSKRPPARPVGPVKAQKPVAKKKPKVPVLGGGLMGLGGTGAQGMMP